MSVQFGPATTYWLLSEGTRTPIYTSQHTNHPTIGVSKDLTAILPIILVFFQTMSLVWAFDQILPFVWNFSDDWITEECFEVNAMDRLHAARCFN